MAKEKRSQHILLHKCFGALILLCLIVTVIASAVAGVSVTWITIRCAMVWAILSALSVIVIKSWSKWDDVRKENDQKFRPQ